MGGKVFGICMILSFLCLVGIVVMQVLECKVLSVF